MMPLQMTLLLCPMGQSLFSQRLICCDHPSL